MNNINSYKSKFDNRILVVLLSKDNEKYNDFKPMFNDHGLAFLFDNKYIFVDVEALNKKNYGKDHLTFIESHEIAHLKLNHLKNPSREVEAEADFFGILLCKFKKFNKAAKIGVSYFKERNKISFEKYKKNNYSKFKKNKIIKSYIQ